MLLSCLLFITRWISTIYTLCSLPLSQNGWSEIILFDTASVVYMDDAKPYDGYNPL